MRVEILLTVLLCARAYAAPDPAALIRSAMPPGFEPVVLREPISVPVPVLLQVPSESDTQTVTLAPLLDRHLSTTDSFMGEGGVTFVSGTLDLAKQGYLAVSPPGDAATFVKIERGMSGVWSDGIHLYRVNLSVNFFRPRLSNYIQIRNVSTGQVVWEKRILELFRLTYKAGEPVYIGGRPYRLFYSQRPSLGLCFIYDDASSGVHDYKFYMVPVEYIKGLYPVSFIMFGGDIVKLQTSADLSTLLITR